MANPGPKLNQMFFPKGHLLNFQTTDIFLDIISTSSYHTPLQIPYPKKPFTYKLNTESICIQYVFIGRQQQMKLTFRAEN